MSCHDSEFLLSLSPSLHPLKFIEIQIFTKYYPVWVHFWDSTVHNLGVNWEYTGSKLEINWELTASKLEINWELTGNKLRVNRELTGISSGVNWEKTESKLEKKLRVNWEKTESKLGENWYQFSGNKPRENSWVNFEFSPS